MTCNDCDSATQLILGFGIEVNHCVCLGAWVTKTLKIKLASQKFRSRLQRECTVQSHPLLQAAYDLKGRLVGILHCFHLGGIGDLA